MIELPFLTDSDDTVIQLASSFERRVVDTIIVKRDDSSKIIRLIRFNARLGWYESNPCVADCTYSRQAVLTGLQSSNAHRQIPFQIQTSSVRVLHLCASFISYFRVMGRTCTCGGRGLLSQSVRGQSEP